MNFYVECASGEEIALPEPLNWLLEYGTDSPCDSFELILPWKGSFPVELKQWAKFRGEEEGEIRFVGLIDQVEGSISTLGAKLYLSGRGMAGRLLDNETLGVEYMTATLQDILGNYVTSLGITVAEAENLPALSPFLVETGSSCWTALKDFCCYYGTVVPRFNKTGELLLNSFNDDKTWEIGDDCPVLESRCCEKRYGVYSEVWIRDRVTKEVNVATDAEFQAQGLSCRRVVTTASGSNSQARSYDASFRLEQSATEKFRLWLKIPIHVHWDIGDCVAINRTDFANNGTYRLMRLSLASNGTGAYSLLELGEC